MAHGKYDGSLTANAIVSEIGRVLVSLVVVLGFFYVLRQWMVLKIDGGSSEVLSMMVGALTTSFASVVLHWINTSVGQTDARRSQNALTDKLVDVVAASAPVAAVVQPTSTPWWSALTPAENSAIEAVMPGDARVAAFAVAAKVGVATSDDLDYLVSKGLLTAERAAEIRKIV